MLPHEHPLHDGEALKSRPLGSRAGLRQPLPFYDDFAFVLLKFLEHQQVLSSRASRTAVLPAAASTTSSAQLSNASGSFHAGADAGGAISADVAQSSLSAVADGLGGLKELLQRAQRVTDVCDGDSCMGRGDSLSGMSALSQSTVYLVRLKQLLEEQVHSLEAGKLGLGGVDESCLEVGSSLQGLDSVHTCDKPFTTGGSAESEISSVTTVKRNGRRYTVPESRHSTVTQPPTYGATAVCDSETSSATSFDRLVGVPAQTPQPAFCATECHGRLLLGLQQHLARTLSELENAVEAEAAALGGMRGILTTNLAEHLQLNFVGGLLATLNEVRCPAHSSLQQDSLERRDHDVCEFCEVSRIADRVSRVMLDAKVGFSYGAKGPGAAKLVVHEIAPSALVADATPDSPPFTNEDGLAQGFGLQGNGFPMMAVTQHVWCYQTILRQRFPSSGAGNWGTLERTRFFVESLRSPTPTAPRSPLSVPQSTASAEALEARTQQTSLHTRASSSTPSPCVQRSPPSASHVLADADKARKGLARTLPSRESTPTRPPPLVDHTQEKGAAPTPMRRYAMENESEPRDGRAIDKESITLRALSEGQPLFQTDPGTYNEPSASESTVHVQDLSVHIVSASSTPTRSELESVPESNPRVETLNGLINRLQPCCLFDSFVHRCGSRAQGPAGSSGDSASRVRSFPVTAPHPRASSRASSGVSSPTLSKSRSPPPLQPQPTNTAHGSPTISSSVPVVMKARPSFLSSSSPERSPSLMD